MKRHNDPTKNHLLSSLPKAEYERLAEHLELVELKAGKTLYEPQGKLEHVYFPTTAIVSLLYEMESGETAAIAVIGSEAILGIALFMGGATTPNHAVVQCDGYAYRLKAELLNKEFNRAGPVLRLLLRYTQALLTQMQQTAMCNQLHSLDEQLCRWLLLTFDRLSTRTLSMTQLQLADMLGVSREGINEAIGKLKGGGLIASRRGRIDMLDRPGLEKAVCECYEVVKKEYDRLINDIPRHDPKHVLGASSN